MLSIATAAHCSCSFSKRFQASESHSPLPGSLCKQFWVPTGGRRIVFHPLGSSLSCRVYKEGDGGSGDGRGGMGGSGGSGGHGDGAYGKVGGIGVFGSLWARYMETLEDHPLITKSLTAGILNLFADLVCQVVFEKVQQVDIQRLLSFTAIGLFMSGPGLHFWYGLLPKVIPVPGFSGVLLRLAADQIIFTPLGVVCLFIALCTFEGRQQEIEAKLRKDWLQLVVANWKVWVPFQLINFGFIPPQLQVNFQLSIFWL
ncbi:hypothetical protein GOP47_0008389 [Adiantum capillus-veneris]|uniref:Uncharacterized protein n=1 Tax=Adiantum capillus-veneris TaxID=13818 RepID=A0A9D4UYG6_ADICA|nr:hypothetical protein GOP47_0008389 [Adiantum capillus-veneris]